MNFKKCIKIVFLLLGVSTITLFSNGSRTEAMVRGTNIGTIKNSAVSTGALKNGNFSSSLKLKVGNGKITIDKKGIQSTTGSSGISKGKLGKSNNGYVTSEVKVEDGIKTFKESLKIPGGLNKPGKKTLESEKKLSGSQKSVVLSSPKVLSKKEEKKLEIKDKENSGTSGIVNVASNVETNKNKKLTGSAKAIQQKVVEKEENKQTAKQGKASNIVESNVSTTKSLDEIVVEETNVEVTKAKKEKKVKIEDSANVAKISTTGETPKDAKVKKEKVKEDTKGDSKASTKSGNGVYVSKLILPEGIKAEQKGNPTRKYGKLNLTNSEKGAFGARKHRFGFTDVNEIDTRYINEKIEPEAYYAQFVTNKGEVITYKTTNKTLGNVKYGEVGRDKVVNPKTGKEESVIYVSKGNWHKGSDIIEVIENKKAQAATEKQASLEKTQAPVVLPLDQTKGNVNENIKPKNQDNFEENVVSFININPTKEDEGPNVSGGIIKDKMLNKIIIDGEGFDRVLLNQLEGKEIKTSLGAVKDGILYEGKITNSDNN